MRFAFGGFYHIVNRGVDGKIIFRQRSDYERFLKGLHAFNSPRPCQLRDVASTESTEIRSQEERLVDVLSYCLMKDHTHLSMRAKSPQKASLFLQKVFIGYTMYFNTKYKRHGVLFQGKAKAVPVKRGEHLDHLFQYIHLNPLDYVDRRWREHGVRNTTGIRKAILEYPWSSIRSVIGEHEDPILNLELLCELVPPKKEFLQDLLSWASGDPISGTEVWE